MRRESGERWECGENAVKGAFIRKIDWHCLPKAEIYNKDSQILFI